MFLEATCCCLEATRTCPLRGLIGMSSPSILQINGAQAPHALTTLFAVYMLFDVSILNVPSGFLWRFVTSVCVCIFAPYCFALSTIEKVSRYGLTMESVLHSRPPYRLSARYGDSLRESSRFSIVKSRPACCCWLTQRSAASSSTSFSQTRTLPGLRYSNGISSSLLNSLTSF